MEAKDEFYPHGPVQARAALLEVIEDCYDRDAGVKRPVDAHLLDPRRFDVGQDEVFRTYLDCANAALVGLTGCPAVLHLSHLGKTVVLQEPFDVWVVAGARVAHEVEGPSVVCLVDVFGEDHAGGAASGCPSEGDAEGAHNERLVELMKVGIARICHDGDERVARLLKDGVDVSEFRHAEGGGGARDAWSV